jgi:hypothetical protein
MGYYAYGIFAVPLVATPERYRKKRMLRCGVSDLVGAGLGASRFCETHASQCVRANRRGIRAHCTECLDPRSHRAANGNEDVARTTNRDLDNEDRSRMAEDQRNADAWP